jgi:UDP-glucose 4-epimerase
VTYLLTGGAGYIGAHVARTMTESGHDVVVLDDLSTGYADRLPAGVPLVRASVLDTDAVVAALARHEVRGVIHFAGKKAVAESVERPLHYYRENVGGMISLLEAMRTAGVTRIVFSSSAAVYGTPASDRVTEQSPTTPESPYGVTKLVCEGLLRDAAAASDLRHVSLRYFNVAGAATPELADRGVHNLIPLVLSALREGRRPTMFGDDYPTPDGSCVRDYVHVQDLASAHVIAAERLDRGLVPSVLNVGTGTGSSVREVMETTARVTGRPVDYEVRPRRAGDPAQVVASADRIRAEFGWTARLDLAAMISSAWAVRATPLGAR